MLLYCLQIIWAFYKPAPRIWAITCSHLELGLLHACAFEGGHFPQVNFQVPEAIEPKAGSAMYKCEVRPELVYCGTWCVRMGPIMCSSQKPDACATEGRGGRVRQARQG